MVFQLLNIERKDVPGKILLIPFFPEKKYLSKIRRLADKIKKVLFSEFIFYNDMVIITGFLGYPAVLTILEFVENLREKELFFLGTAGSLNKELDKPDVLSVREIFPDDPIKNLSEKKSFVMTENHKNTFKKCVGITVDIIQRETPDWIVEKRGEGMDFVEMEIFPIAALLNRGFEARVVLTDFITSRGINSFSEKNRIKEMFIEQFETFGGL